MERTRRQTIQAMLEGQAWTVEDLALTLAVPRKLVLDDLQHLTRSAETRRRLQVEPARCRECGFTFKQRDKLSKPSRCPRCKGERLSPPVFHLC